MATISELVSVYKGQAQVKIYELGNDILEYRAGGIDQTSINNKLFDIKELRWSLQLLDSGLSDITDDNKYEYIHYLQRKHDLNVSAALVVGQMVNNVVETIYTTTGSGGGGGSSNIVIDSEPSNGSPNAVSSGGVYDALQDLLPRDGSRPMTGDLDVPSDFLISNNTTGVRLDVGYVVSTSGSIQMTADNLDIQLNAGGNIELNGDSIKLTNVDANSRIRLDGDNNIVPISKGETDISSVIPIKWAFEKINTIGTYGSDRLNVLLIGDSLRKSYIEDQFTNYKQNLDGGEFDGEHEPTVLAGSVTWETASYDNTYSPTGRKYSFAASSSAVWTKSTSTKTRQIVVYAIKENGAGNITVSISTKGGAYVDDATYTNYSLNNTSTPECFPITITMGSNDYYSVKISNNGTAIKIIGVAFKSNTGLFTADFGRGGISLEQIVTTPAAIYEPFLQDIAPDIAFLTLKDVGAEFAALDASLISLKNILVDALQASITVNSITGSFLPLDIIAFGSNATQSGTNDVVANQKIKDWVDTNYDLTKNYYYVPVYDLVDFPQANASGLMQDTVHPNTKGKSFFSSVTDKLSIMTNNSLFVVTKNLYGDRINTRSVLTDGGGPVDPNIHLAEIKTTGALSLSYYGLTSSMVVRYDASAVVPLASPMKSEFTHESAQTVTAVDMFHSKVTLSNTGGITTLTHFKAKEPASTAGGVVTNAIGFDVEAMTIGTNRYAYRAQNTDSQYNLYMNSTSRNYLGGPTGIGTTEPTAKSGNNGKALLVTGFNSSTLATVEIKAGTSATGSALVIKENSGSANAVVVSADGNLYIPRSQNSFMIGSETAANLVGKITIRMSTASHVGISIRQASSHTGDLIRILNNSDVTIAKFDKDFVLHTPATSTSNANLVLSPAAFTPSSPSNGWMWNDGTDVKIRMGGVNKTYLLYDPTARPTYTTSSLSVSRTFNADTATTAEVGAVLHALISDLRSLNILL
jgi:hypothetical protein